MSRPSNDTSELTTDHLLALLAVKLDRLTERVADLESIVDEHICARAENQAERDP
jgi:hypothetical protein